MTRHTAEIEVATNAVKEAAELYMRDRKASKDKDSPVGTYDVVSENDILAEKMIKESISKAFPDDSFICEESGDDIHSDRRWIIDPIDGTINYVHGIPVFGTQVALTEGDEPLISVMFLPTCDEMYVAESGCGATMNGRKLDMRHTVEMKKSILSIGDYSRGSIEFRENQSRLMDVLRDRIGRIKMMGSSCYDFCMFASGRVDYHTRFIRNPWDFVPGFLLAKESGAVFDGDLYERKKLYIAACSEENLASITETINSEMVWYSDG